MTERGTERDEEKELSSLDLVPSVGGIDKLSARPARTQWNKEETRQSFHFPQPSGSLLLSLCLCLALFTLEKTKASSLLQAMIAVIRMHRRSRCDGASPRGDSACKSCPGLQAEVVSAPPHIPSAPGVQLSAVLLLRRPDKQLQPEELLQLQMSGWARADSSRSQWERGKSRCVQQIGIALKQQPRCEGDGFSLRQSDCKPRASRPVRQADSEADFSQALLLQDPA
ncbi:unnamed protein product [Pleuronectes platessa]|uniref:Uncharacterized protein n=1 Tax=Pleuronectes platessa TaxID=8262 RepID=A0A9N7YLD4_PLEPL|nr:unnamed protein product [Pleuronectes platessa]